MATAHRMTGRPLASLPSEEQAMRRILNLRKLKREWQREWRKNPKNRAAERRKQSESKRNRRVLVRQERCFFCGGRGYCRLVEYVAPAKDGSNKVVSCQVRWCGQC